MTHLRGFVVVVVLSLLMFSLDAVSQPSPTAITIDGSFSDWVGVEPETSGLLSETTGEVAEPLNDIATVWRATDAKGLCLSLQFAKPYIKGNQWGVHVLMDTDLNKGTGFPATPVGVDYLVQLDSSLASTLMVHRRMEGANDSTWSKWHNGVPIPNTVAVGSGLDSNRIELRIPWENLPGVNPKAPALRFRISENSPLMQAGQGEWVPDFDQGYFSVGSDPGSMSNAENCLLNGDFEQLTDAAARPLPQNWIEFPGDGKGTIEVTRKGGKSLHLATSTDGAVGMNSTLIPVSHGLLRYRYMVSSSGVDGDNFLICMIGCNELKGAEVDRQSFSPQNPPVGDGQWHTVNVEFRFSNASQSLVALRINEGTPKVGAGDWLIDDIEVYAIHEGPQPRLAGVWSDHPLADINQPIRFSTWVVNDGDSPAKELTVSVETGGMKADSNSKSLSEVKPGEFERVDWTLSSPAKGQFEVRAQLSAPNQSSAVKVLTDPYQILVIDPKEGLTRQELCTDEKGFWRQLNKPAALQEGNTATLTPIQPKRSGEIGHNLYGICVQLPRDKDYEDPFNPNHLIDGDPDTCWSSQQRPNSLPGNVPWVEIQLPKAAEITKVNLIPYWNNTDYPLGFRLLAWTQEGAWKEVLSKKSIRLGKSGLMRGDKYLQEYPLPSPVSTDRWRIEFERLPLSGGNYAEVSQGYKARLAGIELIGREGKNLALIESGVQASASDIFTCWQNTTKNVNESYKRLLDLGIKWVRITQWGDQTEWAAVERKKGVFAMDQATDAAISELAANGVEILYGLQYGNALYNDINDNPENKPWGEIGPVYKEGHPFYLHNGPKTEAARQAFLRYVDYVVHRYKDKVHYWELWNEENGWFPNHEPELYGKLLAAVGPKLKEIDPSAYFVFGGTAAPAPLTVERALREGGTPFVDAYAFHPYGIDKPEGGMGTMEFYKGESLGKSREQTGWNTVEQVLAGVREPWAAQGRPNIDVWMNEWGTNVTGLEYTYNPGIGEFGATKYLMRFHLYSAWLGVRTAWWAFYNQNMSQDWGVIDPHDYSLRPLSYGLRNLCSLVSDVQPIHPCPASLETQAPDPRIISFKRDGKDETLLLAWATDLVDEKIKDYRGTITLSLASKPKTVTVTDLYWGLSQPAEVNYENGQLKVAGIVIRDYPVLVTVSQD